MKKLPVILAALIVVLAFQACNEDEGPRDENKNPGDTIPDVSDIIIFTDNFEWQIVLKGWIDGLPGMESIYYCDTITFYYSGDTMLTNSIEDQQMFYDYKTFRYDKVATTSGRYSDTTYSSGINGFLRIDSATNMVFWKSSYDAIDFLIYNFNSEVGDTLQLTNYSQKPIVSSIDTISIGNYRLKRFSLNSGTGDMIAGIGSSLGIPYHGQASKCSSVQVEIMYFEMDGIRNQIIEN